MTWLNDSFVVPYLLLVIFGLSVMLFLCVWVYRSLEREYKRVNDALWESKGFIMSLIGEHYKALDKSHNNLEAVRSRARLCDRAAMRRKWDRLMGNPVAKLGAWRSMSPSVAKGRMAEIFYKLQEELKETREAKDRCNITAFIDGIADIMYVCEAAGIWLGVDMNKAFLAVHKSNMTKSPYKFKLDRRGKDYDFEEPDFSEAMGKRG